jgi:hypothetical protein
MLTNPFEESIFTIFMMWGLMDVDILKLNNFTYWLIDYAGTGILNLGPCTW